VPQEHITGLIMSTICYKLVVLVASCSKNNDYCLSLCVCNIMYVKKVGVYDRLLSYITSEYKKLCISIDGIISIG
jgi:hypothetical protein